VRHSIGALFVLSLAASGCAVGSDAAPTGEKVVLPSEEVFEFAPEGVEINVEKAEQEDPLEAKGAFSRTFGPTYTQAVTIANGQTVSFSTSGGTVGVDPVLVLFRRHDNLAAFPVNYTERVGIQTLAINDDSVGIHSSITYTNTTGVTENARLMVFAWNNSTGQVNLSGVGTVDVRAGSVRTSGTAGQAWTTGSTGSGDPWLFTFDLGFGGNGVWNDDSNGTFESTITGATSLTMWYVAHGWGAGGTTTINN
jgi:hypothetical protein